ncbi:MAG: hypothetical protein EOP48_25470 [Sphingobacteriales bacterium]|nr:MAG: hypothetical protein EOP48_25470 [Sphingobacteriales bacterium]
MEIQFEQNKNFNQSHREEASVTDTKLGEKGKPQGKEGDPNIRLANREALQTEKTELDRRPYDVASGNASDIGDESSSAVAGLRSDQQDVASGDSKPLAEDPDIKTETENQENNEENDGNE